MFVGHNSNRAIPADQSAVTMASAVAQGFDRLERLFSKKKLGSIRRSKPRKSALGDSPAASPPLLEVPDERISFPAPSFIRPTTTRMIAREESSLSPRSSKSSTRSGSVADPPKPASTPRLSRRLSVPDSHRPGSSCRRSTSSPAPRVPRRSSSLASYSQAGHSSLASLIHYEFTVLEGRNEERSLASLWAPPPRPVSPGPNTQLDDAHKDILCDFPLPPRLDTPPPSDPEENVSIPLTTYTQNLTAPPPTAGQPNPEPSPSLTAVPDLLLPSPQLGSYTDTRPILQRDSLSDATIPQVLWTSGEQHRFSEPASPTTTDPVLQEPAVGEFLGLSDDDIAEPHLAPNASMAVELGQSQSRPVTADGAVAPPRTPTSPPRRGLRDIGLNPQTPPPPILPPSPCLLRRMSAQLSVVSTDDRAAATAAFEVARIATRYRFDLIYVISLWPQHMLRPRARPNFATDIFKSSPSASSSGAAAASSACPSTRTSARLSQDSHTFETTPPSSIDEQEQVTGDLPARERGSLNYRFLAAYGLHTVKPPLNIAHSVHSKILKSKGWIEYREPNPRENEFARGYACSFYSGNAPVEGGVRRSSVDSCDAENGPESPTTTAAALAALRGSGGNRMAASQRRDGSKNNRGIVFAAYRKPRTDGTNLAMSGAELREMQRDAEALVDMILDFHMMKRRGEEMEMMRSGGVGSSGVDLAFLQGRPRTSA